MTFRCWVAVASCSACASAEPRALTVTDAGDTLAYPDGSTSSRPPSSPRPDDGSASESTASFADAHADAVTGVGAAGDSSPGFIGGAAASVHDDFEQGSLASWTLTDRDFNPLLATSAVVTIDTTIAHGGSHAVKISPSNGIGGFFGTSPPGSTFYGRAWAYMSADPGMGHWEQTVARGAARNAGTSPVELRIGGQFGILYVNDNQTDGYFLTNSNFFTDHMGVAPPVGKWVCEEFYFGEDTIKWWITQAGGAPTVTPFVDIEPATTWYQGTPATPWSPVYATIAFGYGIFGSAPVDVWFDDVALDSRRIGCD